MQSDTDHRKHYLRRVAKVKEGWSSDQPSVCPPPSSSSCRLCGVRVVERVQQSPLVVCRVREQMTVDAVHISTEVPILRDSENRLTPAAIENAAYVWRIAYGGR